MDFGAFDHMKGNLSLKNQAARIANCYFKLLASGLLMSLSYWVLNSVLLVPKIFEQPIIKHQSC